ncbi:hypothetical protein BLNAU_1508 [Blattamonas nauphoetae]|uniref:Uncharacterized protein n=1 Tax=Blattamonas nauphoetae TaxID=2049346 RepID=A0ABQ9YI73_9EUKA|nr:hypothetical protein BLNAU_1508 [Blattamonas nauphoetae]
MRPHAPDTIPLLSTLYAIGNQSSGKPIPHLVNTDKPCVFFLNHINEPFCLMSLSFRRISERNVPNERRLIHSLGMIFHEEIQLVLSTFLPTSTHIRPLIQNEGEMLLDVFSTKST